MCRLVREHAPQAVIVVGGHVASIEGLETLVDADHVVRGEGIAWLRKFLGEEVSAPVAHPIIPSSFGFRLMGLPPTGGGGSSATIIPSVGCPMGCNFCTTSTFFGGKGKFVNFYERGADLYNVMAEAERRLKVSSFFMMDENFLLYKKRALELLEKMKAAGKAWSLYVFSSVNAIRQYDVRQLLELGVEWIWLGLEGPGSGYQKLAGSDTLTLTRELQSHGVAIHGSTIIGLEHHTPENIQADLDHAIAHDAVFHQFMLYTPMPGTPLHTQMTREGRMLDGIDIADTHGQFKFNFTHSSISRDESKTLLDRAFRLDYERNGPSLYRLIRTTFRRTQQLRNDRDARLRARAARDAGRLAGGYGAALWAMEKHLRSTNRPMSARIRALRTEVERESGVTSRAINRTLGPLLHWTSARDARKYPNGRPLEPRTFVERTNWT
jgi:radical SAM superfamily enzyme YgiQ (UPF0313 family)